MHIFPNFNYVFLVEIQKNIKIEKYKKKVFILMFFKEKHN